MKRLSFATVGAGFWSHYQLAAWQELPSVQCIAVCDRDRARAEKLAAIRGVPAIYTDASEMIGREQPDFLDIVTEAAGHVDLVKLAAAMKVPVICQKPMALTPGECEELVATCRKAGVPFAIHENWRWQTALRRVKELLVEGVIGTPFRCRIDMISGFDVFANQPNLRTETRFILADMGCHLFDLARSYFGEASAVYCRTARVHPDIRGEDVATAVLGMNDGRTTVTVNMAYAGTPLEHECFPETLVFIEGDRGSIEVTPGCRIRVTTRMGTHVTHARPPRFAWAEPDYAIVQASMVACQKDLVHSLVSGVPSETDAADNLRTMRLVFAAYDSAQGGQVVSVGG
ncbi:MAG TPA: Gfo/Idh/MocA family oxidoreductase [Gemmataceae bacterium]|nr:Gfo/Idh/MocA family oxidoreductase [Gemmataceae bacterium]